MSMPTFSQMRWRTAIPMTLLLLVLLISMVFSLGSRCLLSDSR